jgi:hypothetical protein
MLNFGFGLGMVIIAVATQYLLKKRLKHAKVSKAFMWIAWIFAAIGGEAMSRQVGNTAGVTSGGAAIVSVVMLLVLIVDVADKRPDWPAFVVTITAPWFMRLAGGQAGQLFDAILTPIQAIGQTIAGFLGM